MTDAVTQAVPLVEIADFGDNPGDLRMFVASPGSSRPRRPLVVVLHGCTQTAAGYDAASGWSRLAAERDFVVVYAQQRRVNNDQTCFSWFRPVDVAREGGEAASIRAMIAYAITDLAIDMRRVHICGLSAGGAMACAMLAAFPEVFASGAILAGLPYGAASSVGEAFEAMAGGRVRKAQVWGGLARTASGGHAGAWPDVAIWQGGADRVVRPVNAVELVKQWTDVHGVGAAIPDEDRVGAAHRRRWRDAAGRARVIEYALPELGHGAPVDDETPPAPFFLPAGLSSTRQIAADFGLMPASWPRRLLESIGVAAG